MIYPTCGLFSRFHPSLFSLQVVFDRDLLITHMVSPEGEQLKLVEAIDPKGQNVEGWMLELEGQMRLTVSRKRCATALPALWALVVLFVRYEQ